MRWALTTLLVLACGCITRGAPMVQVLGKLTGVQTGWYHVKPLLLVDDDGALSLPPASSLEDESDAPYMERVLQTHQRQFSPMPALEAKTDCAAVTQGSAPDGRTVYVFVHGIGGVGHEWVGVIPTLAQTGPAAMFMYKWFAYAERGSILRGLLDGVHRLAQCYEGSPIVLLGHSAGGVLGAFAASRFELGDRAQPLTIITVASPLAGVGATEFSSDDDRTQFFNDLGSVRLGGYPPAAPNVRVLHLRTQYPADRVMKPSRAGYQPNALSAVVKGSTLIDLPPTLTHDDSLQYVAMQLAAGRLLRPDEPAPAAVASPTAAQSMPAP